MSQRHPPYGHPDPNAHYASRLQPLQRRSNPRSGGSVGVTCDRTVTAGTSPIICTGQCLYLLGNMQPAICRDSFSRNIYASVRLIVSIYSRKKKTINKTCRPSPLHLDARYETFPAPGAPCPCYRALVSIRSVTCSSKWLSERLCHLAAVTVLQSTPCCVRYPSGPYRNHHIIASHSSMLLWLCRCRFCLFTSRGLWDPDFGHGL